MIPLQDMVRSMRLTARLRLLSAQHDDNFVHMYAFLTRRALGVLVVSLSKQ